MSSSESSVNEETLPAVEFPTRLLPKPLPVEMRKGGMVVIDHQLFTWGKAARSVRFDRVEWWTASPLSRDYVRAQLTSGKKRIDAWVFTDRHTGQTFLHGYFD